MDFFPARESIHPGFLKGSNTNSVFSRMTRQSTLYGIKRFQPVVVLLRLYFVLIRNKTMVRGFEAVVSPDLPA